MMKNSKISFVLALFTLASMALGTVALCTYEKLLSAIIPTQSGKCLDGAFGAVRNNFDFCQYDQGTPAEVQAIKDLCLQDVNCVAYEVENTDTIFSFDEVIRILYCDGTLPPSCPTSFGGESFTSTLRIDTNSGTCPIDADFTFGTSVECWRKVGCANQKVPPATAGCGGDPHAYTWAGKRYNFHGECDLVFVSAQSFQQGTGLDVHLRTKIESVYSIIEVIAVKVGDAVFEFNHAMVGYPKYYANGMELAGLPYEEGPFKVSMHDVYNEDFNKMIQIITIAIGLETTLHISVMDQWVHVDIKASDVMGNKGLTGSFPKGEMLGRDGTDLSHDRNAFGMQWQVQPDEPHLFHSTPEGHPQAPDSTCKLPAEDGHQYLRARNAELYHMAMAACKKEGISGLDLEDCVFDVSVMNNPMIAAAWWAMEKEE